MLRRIFVAVVLLGGCSSEQQSADGGSDAGGFDVATGDSSQADTGTDAGVVTCTGVDPLVADPNAPHGIYAVEFTPTDFNSAFLSEPSICGANVFVPWSAVDKGPDAGVQYDFASTDALIAPWKGVGKKVNLLVDGVGFGNNQTVTPKYVLDTVPSKTCNGATPYPEVWTSGYIAPYQKFVAAVIAHYGMDPDIGYIRVGMSVGAQADVTCVPELSDAGLTEALFESYVSTMARFEASQPHTVQLMLAIGPYGPGGTKGDISLPDWEAALAVDAGLGFGNQGLSGQDIDASLHCNADWCANFDEFAGRVPLYLQPIAASSPDGGGSVGSLVPLLPFAMSHHTQIFEIYSSDLAIAFDPTHPLNAEYGAAYKALFDSTAAVLGAKP